MVSKTIQIAFGFKHMLVLVVVLLGAGGWVMAWLREGDVTRERAKRQRVELEAAEFQQAQVVKDDELGKDLVRLQDALDKARKAGTSPLGAMHIKTGEVEVALPDESATFLEGAVGGEYEESSADTPQRVIAVSAEMEGILTGTAVGDIYVQGGLYATVREDATGFERTLTLPLDKKNSTFVVSKQLQRALRNEYAGKKWSLLRPPKQWRAGPVAGLGLCGGMQSGLDACVFVGYGVQF